MIISCPVFYHLAIVSNYYVMSLNGSPPWHYSEEEKYPSIYSSFTKDATVIISKKFYNKIGNEFIAKRIFVISKAGMTLIDAMTETQDLREVFIMGGACIFKQTQKMISGIYIIRIHQDYPGDNYYPKISKDLKIKATVEDKNNPNVVYSYYERNWEKSH